MLFLGALCRERRRPAGAPCVNALRPKRSQGKDLSMVNLESGTLNPASLGTWIPKGTSW